MKKIISILMTVLLLSLVGCSTEKPEDAVNKYFSAAQKFNIEEMMGSVVNSNTEDIGDILDVMEAEDEYYQYLEDYLMPNAEKMTYEITASEVNDDNATVTVYSRYVDGGPLLKATIGELFTKMMETAFDDVVPIEEESNQMFLDAMEEQAKIIEETYKEVTININCIQVDGQWYIAEVSDELLDVVVSGFISAGKDMDSIFSGEED